MNAASPSRGPRKTSARRPAEFSTQDTPLQTGLQLLAGSLAWVRDECSERERLAFADLAPRMVARSLGRELLMLEVDDVLRRAA